MAKLTKTGARRLTTELDRIASVIQEQCEILGIPKKIAMDFARRCDCVSDAVERRAIANSLAVGKEPSDSQSLQNSYSMGEEQSGPIVTVDDDEPFMSGHFTQNRFDELEDAQESGLQDGFESPSVKSASRKRSHGFELTK